MTIEAQARLLVQAVFPATCLQLLGLPEHVRNKLSLGQYHTDLLQLAAQPPRSHPSAALFAPRDASGRCNTSRALYARPLKAGYSMFSGQTGHDGQPILNPNQLASEPPSSQPSGMIDRPLNQTLPGHHGSRHSTAASQQKGALDICVGDAVSLSVEVHSTLPQAVKLEGVTLTLALLQEVTIAYSPKSATSSRTDFSHTASSVKQRASDSPMAPSTARSRSGDLTAAPADDADVTTQWQETEELVCCLTQAAGGTEAPPSSVASQQSGQGGHSDGSMSPGVVVAQPGLNQLAFRALPLKRGLYTLKHVDAHLGCLPLHIPVMLTPPSEFDFPSSSDRPLAPSAAGSESTSLSASSLGTVLNTGEIQQETVVLNVHSCRQRVAVSAAALRGTLVAGQPQWLAVAIMPLHDSLHEACVHVGMASARQAGSDQAPGSSTLGASLGSRSSTASTSFSPEDAAPSHLPGIDIRHPDRAVIAPLHPSAQHPDPQPHSGSATTQGQSHAPARDHGSRETPSSTAGLHGTPLQTQLPQQREPDHASEEQAETGTSELRHDGGPEASVSGSSWVSLEGSQGPNLPPWTATQPSLLWMWVQPGRLLQQQLTWVVWKPTPEPDDRAERV